LSLLVNARSRKTNVHFAVTVVSESISVRFWEDEAFRFFIDGQLPLVE
tara:strand:- start:9414 stop:9557 length:144 start_codon:yes stop_codon:yes gene_type:complete